MCVWKSYFRVLLHKLPSKVSVTSKELGRLYMHAQRHSHAKNQIRAEQSSALKAETHHTFIPLYLFHLLFSLAEYPSLFTLTTTSFSFYCLWRVVDQHKTIIPCICVFFYGTNMNCFYREKTCFDSAVIIYLSECWLYNFSNCGSTRFPE